MREKSKTGSLIFAAGKGSRMKTFEGNKTLLPLVAGSSPFEGSYPILIHILESLPEGPKALVVNHRKDEVIEATRSHDLTYCEQPVLNGTGGALLAARDFLENRNYDRILITMGDVPFVRPSTYENLLGTLEECRMAVLGFRPADKKEYGVLDIENGSVKRIIEWKYWSNFPEEQQDKFDVCNTGIYAFRKADLVKYLGLLGDRGHIVLKERDGRMTEVEEFFITDLVEMMREDGLKTGYAVAGDEYEVMGIDDLQSLLKAQEIFREGA